MDFEFDKEIDTLLRQTAQGAIVSARQNSASEHLDADELSAFAENALPERAKQRSMLHLVNCDECRKSLSTLIILNAEQPFEIAPTEEKQFVRTPIPWYRKLFAVPNLAYTMGALVLMFAGIAAYTVLQSVGDLPNAEVSQTYEKQPNGKGMSSDGDATLNESYTSSNRAASNTMSSNTAVSTNSAVNTLAGSVSNSAVSAPTATMNSNVSVKREAADKDLNAAAKSGEPNELRASTETMDSAAATPAPPPAKESNYESGDVVRNQPSPPSPVSSAQTSELPLNGRGVSPAAKPMMRAESKRKSSELSKTDDREKSLETTVVGGKTFKRTNNVWYDSAYRGQSTTNVARGTNEYRTLDAGLRGIAENLGGTVVIVWKQKAYRIQ